MGMSVSPGAAQPCRRSRPPRYRPHRGGPGVEIGTNRHMDGTHPNGLVSGNRASYWNRVLSTNSPVVSTPSRRASPGRCQTKSWCNSSASPQASNPSESPPDYWDHPSAPSETARGRSREPPVLRAVVLILDPSKAIAEAGIRPVFHAAKPQTLHERLDILGDRRPRAWDAQRRSPPQVKADGRGCGYRASRSPGSPGSSRAHAPPGRADR